LTNRVITRIFAPIKKQPIFIPRMLSFRTIFILLVTGSMLCACSTYKNAWYLQSGNFSSAEEEIPNGQIRIKPLDRLTVVVSSRNPELAVPFNAWSTYSSLSGEPAQGQGNQSLQVRTVDENGMLEMPVIGAVKAAGKTRSELVRLIADRITAGGYIDDPSVNVEFVDMKIAILGEVARPGYYDIIRDKISIFDALALAGDITIYGERDKVAVAREINGRRSIEYIDLTSKSAFDSPIFYLQQNDVVYVKSNRQRAQSGTISQNRTFYLSLAGTIIAVATLIATLVK